MSNSLIRYSQSHIKVFIDLMLMGLNDWQVLWYTNVEGGARFITPWDEGERIHSVCFYSAKQGVTFEFDEINGIRGGSRNAN